MAMERRPVRLKAMGGGVVRRPQPSRPWRTLSWIGIVIGLGLGSAASASKEAVDPGSKPPETAPAPAPLDWHLGASDLTVCGKNRDVLPPGSKVDVEEFAMRLHGTWRLGSRTMRGLTVDARAKFYFDIDHVEAAKATGTAILIDYGNLSVLDPLGLTAECPADATVAALWDVEVRKDDDHKISLIMKGEYFGSYGDLRRGVYATEESSYFHYGGDYLSGRLATPSGGEAFPDDVWDRVDFTTDSLTYISCKNGYIERYLKNSADEPFLDGLPLREAWQKRKENGSLIVPVPVPSVWKETAVGER